MENLKAPLASAFLDELKHRGVSATLDDIEVVAFLHASRDRGSSKPFTFQSCAGLARIVSKARSGFMLGSIGKTGKHAWGPNGIECGDRFNPPPSPFEYFESRPTAAQVEAFLETRLFFDVVSGDRVVSRFLATEKPSEPSSAS